MEGEVVRLLVVWVLHWSVVEVVLRDLHLNLVVDCFRRRSRTC